MFNSERKQKILETIETKQNVTVKELCIIYGVSDATIRKDLNDLCGQGLALRTHGGAMKRNTTRFEQTHEQKVLEAYREKQAIASYVYREICDGETIMLFGGSTVQEMARKLRTVSWTDLTVVTNALSIANELADVEGITIQFIGGTLRKRILNCIGPMSEAALKNLVVDRVFVSVNCVSLKYGLTASNITEGNLVRCMLDVGLRKYLLAHSKKFGGNSFYRVCDLDDIYVVVTDEGLDPDIEEGFAGKKCHLVKVKVR